MGEQQQHSDFMTTKITIKDVITIVILILGFAGAFYQNKASVQELQTENKYLRKELSDIKDRLDKQKSINTTVIQLETKLERIEEDTKSILVLLRDNSH